MLISNILILSLISSIWALEKHQKKKKIKKNKKLSVNTEFVNVDLI